KSTPPRAQATPPEGILGNPGPASRGQPTAGSGRGQWPSANSASWPRPERDAHRLTSVQTGADPATRRWTLLAAGGFVFATVAAYWRALGAGCVWNDQDYVTAPALASLRGLWRIWFEVGATQQYYPVLHSAFWLEHRLWGDNPAGYHLLNILLHAAC